MLNMEPASSSASPREGVLLIAHGSRRQAANDDLVRLAASLGELGIYPIIETSYLELALPDIATGGARCVERGAERVRLLPYFLSAGAHVVDDLEQARVDLSQRFPGVEFVLCPPLGGHPLLVEIILDRLRSVGSIAAC